MKPTLRPGQCCSRINRRTMMSGPCSFVRSSLKPYVDRRTPVQLFDIGPSLDIYLALRNGNGCSELPPAFVSVMSPNQWSYTRLVISFTGGSETSWRCGCGRPDLTTTPPPNTQQCWKHHGFSTWQKSEHVSNKSVVEQSTIIPQ